MNSYFKVGLTLPKSFKKCCYKTRQFKSTFFLNEESGFLLFLTLFKAFLLRCKNGPIVGKKMAIIPDH